MKLHALLAVAAGLFLAADARPQKDAGTKASPILGEWKLASTQDEKHTDPGCEQSRMAVRTDGEVVFKLDGRTTNSGAFTFGTSGKLKSLDLRLADGKTLLGVYEQKGDDLVICFAEAAQDAAGRDGAEGHPVGGDVEAGRARKTAGRPVPARGPVTAESSLSGGEGPTPDGNSGAAT